MSKLLEQTAVILCPHGGVAELHTSSQRVRISGSPVLTVSDVCTIAGCPFVVPSPMMPRPCVSIRWTSSATRVRCGGKPVVLDDSKGLCQSAEQIPQGPPQVTSTQTRVRGK